MLRWHKQVAGDGVENWQALAVVALALFAIYCILIDKIFIGLVTIALAILLSPFFSVLAGR